MHRHIQLEMSGTHNRCTKLAMHNKQYVETCTTTINAEAHTTINAQEHNVEALTTINTEAHTTSNVQVYTTKNQWHTQTMHAEAHKTSTQGHRTRHIQQAMHTQQVLHRHNNKQCNTLALTLV